MPNRTSLIRRLAELRSAFTGETDSSVLPAITEAGQLLDVTERAQLLAALSRNWLTRAMGENPCPPVPRHVRQAVLPDAETAGQRELESGLLAAAGRAVNYLHLRQPADLLRPARVFRMVRPQRTGELVVHVEPPALAPLLLELMPRITAEDDVLGVPGLRVRLRRRHVELYLIDADPQPTVLLANVSYRQWLAAMSFIESAAPTERALEWLGNDPQPLTEQEEQVLAGRHRAPGPAHLSSALLRRALLFGPALWLTTWARGCAALKVEWPLGPSLPSVAGALIHPIFGLPGDIFGVRFPDEEHVTITDTNGPRCAMHPLSGPASLILRPTEGPDSGFANHVLTAGWHDAAQPWADWNTTLTAPHPTS